MTPTGSKIVIGLVVAGLGLAGWAIYREATEPASGTVTGKGYTAAHDSTTCTHTGQSTSCSTTHYAECWEIRYRGSNGRAGDKCISRADYDAYRTGDWYPKPG